ncbi:MAG TPA: putative quinol monooxygenase [Desulfuromonadaceae bacterium]
MPVVTVVATLVAKEAAVELVRTELLKMIEPTRQEPGCLEYRLHQDNADPRLFVFYENWQDQASLERHIATPHYTRYAAAVADALAEKSVHKMTEVA